MFAYFHYLFVKFIPTNYYILKLFLKKKINNNTYFKLPLLVIINKILKNYSIYTI